MTIRELVKRYSILFLGFLAIAIGVALSVKANLGISPLSCLPFILGEGTKWTMGQYTIFINVVFLAVQILLLRKKFEWIQLTQLPLSIVFGVVLDFALLCVQDLNPSSYFMKWVFCLVGCVVLAFGVYLEIKSEAILLPTEGIMVAVETVFHVEFGRVKVLFDVSLVILAVVASWLLFGNIIGVGEGTIAAALLTGALVRLYNEKLDWLMQLLKLEKEEFVEYTD